MSPVAGVMTIPDYMSPTQIVEHVQRLESLGYKYVWMPDIFGREIYVTAGFILANTTRIGVASAIAHVYGRDYIASAQAARTLSEFSGGRFIQGLGVSNPLASQIRGIPWENPVQKIREYVTAIRDYTPMNTPFNGPPVKIFVAEPEKSAPAQKFFPSAQRTTTRQESSLSSSSNASAISEIISVEK